MRLRGFETISNIQYKRDFEQCKEVLIKLTKRE